MKRAAAEAAGAFEHGSEAGRTSGGESLGGRSQSHRAVENSVATGLETHGSDCIENRRIFLCGCIDLRIHRCASPQGEGCGVIGGGKNIRSASAERTTRNFYPRSGEATASVTARALVAEALGASSRS